MAGPTRLTITTLPSSQTTTWTYDKILAAIDAHERGDFSQSAYLANAFGRDDRINACMTTRIQAVSGKNGLDFRLEPSTKGNKARAKKLAKEVEGWWYDALPERTLKRIFRDVLYMGVSISQMQWTRIGNTWIPKPKPWPMRDVYWDETKRCFIVRAQEGDFEVRRGDPNWLIVAASEEEPWLDGLVRSLGLPFLLRNFTARDWARFCERHGLPIIAIEEPTDFTDEDAKKAFATSLRTMGKNGVIRLPQLPDATGGKGQSFKVEFIEAKDTGWASFEAFRKDLSVAIAIAILGQNLSTEVQGGSLAAANVHENVRREYRDSDVELLSTELHDGVCEPYVVLHSPNDRDAAPWPYWETAEPADQNKIVDIANKTAAAITAFKAAGMRVDIAQFIESVGIPMLPGEPIEEVEEPEADPNAEPDDQAEPDEEEEPETKTSRLASGDSLDDAKGFVNGQKFADKLADAGALAARKIIKADVAALLAIIDKAESFEDVRRGLGDAYASMNQDELEELMERCEILARLAGRAAVLEDL
jgi:phage gp29-like protein